jgi:dCMP deaminase|tara:strand:- start:11 stop:427 length:417 start_codon:yes stop_codon:yes gene_type:complete
MRPEWDDIWMSVAHTISQRSIDPRHQVGSIIVTDDNTQLLALGYNGNYKGGPNEIESLKPGQSGLIHAEQNALIKLDYNNPKKKKMYVTLSPCSHCAKMIVNANIHEVIYDEQYRDPAGIEIMKAAGLAVRRLPQSKQ